MPESLSSLLELVAADDVAADAVRELARPVPGDRAGDVALVVGGRVDVDLDEADIGVVDVVGGPVGVDEDVFRGVGHGDGLLRGCFCGLGGGADEAIEQRGAYQRSK